VPHPRAARVGDDHGALVDCRARAKALCPLALLAPSQRSLRNSPPNCHPERSRGICGFVSVSVTTLGCPILAQRGWETMTALSSIAGPALKRFALLLCSRLPRARSAIHPKLSSRAQSRDLQFSFCLGHNPWVPHPRAARVGDHHGALVHQLLSSRAQSRDLRFCFCLGHSPWVPHPRAARVGDHHGALAHQLLSSRRSPERRSRDLRFAQEGESGFTAKP
jgi:hypothetical protein